MQLDYTEQTPELTEYRGLRRAAGMSERSEAAARLGLPRSLFAVCVRDGGKLVGMGRVVGDGGCNFEVVDVVVHPDYQRRGIGSRVIASLMERLRESASPTAYVSLIADDGAEALYEKFGFKPTAPKSVGMSLFL